MVRVRDGREVRELRVIVFEGLGLGLRLGKKSAGRGGGRRGVGGGV